MPTELISVGSTGRCRAINNIIDWRAFFPAGGLLPFTSFLNYTIISLFLCHDSATITRHGLDQTIRVGTSTFFYRASWISVLFHVTTLLLPDAEKQKREIHKICRWRTNLIYNILYKHTLYLGRIIWSCYVYIRLQWHHCCLCLYRKLRPWEDIW